MAKDRSSHSSLPGEGMGLSKDDILRGRTNFDRLFEGAVTIYSENHLSLRAYTFSNEAYECKMGFIVARRLGNAVKRNYIKRIFREAYRLNRHALVLTLASEPVGLHGAILAKTIQMDFSTAEKEIVNLLDRLVDDLHSTFDL